MSLKKRIGVWLWATPVLLSSLIFWPFWLLLLAALLVNLLGRIVPVADLKGELGGVIHMPAIMKNLTRKCGEKLVTEISRVKYSILTLSVTLMASVVAAVVVMAVFENDGHLVHDLADEIGGYVAIVGLVLGLPALCYAMVTDDEVKRIGEEIDRRTMKKVRNEIKHRLAEFENGLEPDQSLQVFVPNSDRSLLQPIYDPSKTGPDDGWGIKPEAPQAVTGNAFADNKYIGVDDINPSQYSLLRLTRKQQRQYKDIKAVAAAPVAGQGETSPGRKDPVGVLTVFSTDSTNHLEGEEFKRKHKDAAKELTDVLSDYIPQRGPLTEARIRAGFHQ